MFGYRGFKSKAECERYYSDIRNYADEVPAMEVYAKEFGQKERQMSAPSTVYVVNAIKDNISKAASWGDIKYVNIDYVFGDQLERGIDGSNVMPEQPWQRLVKCAAEFNPARDYLLIAGDHLQLVALAGLLAKRYDSYSVLRWDRQAMGYFPVTLPGIRA